MSSTHIQLLFFNLRLISGRVFPKIFALIARVWTGGYRGALGVWLLCRGTPRPLSGVAPVTDGGGLSESVAPRSPICSDVHKAPSPTAPPSTAVSDLEDLNTASGSPPNASGIPTPRLCAKEGTPFFVTAPELLQRYTRREKMQVYLHVDAKDLLDTVHSQNEIPWNINARAGYAVVCAVHDVPAAWTAQVNPDGALYYVHNSIFLNILTDAPLHEPPILQIVMAFVAQIEVFWSTNAIPSDPTANLVLDLTRDENGPPVCGYYLADHSRRIVFWYDVFELDVIPRCYDVYGAHSPQHIQLELEAQYWYHCALFPSTLTVTPDLIRELRHTLVFVIGTSTESFSLDDLLRILPVMESLKDGDIGNANEYYGGAFVISRFMWSFVSHKFYHFYGESCARLQNQASVFVDTPTRSLLFQITVPLLFNAPISHVRTLEGIYVDELLSSVPWRDFLEKSCSEWQELVLYATVLLNADMAFLSIPTVEHGSGTTMGQIASYVSVMASLGSVIVGLVLMRQNRIRMDDDIVVSAAFLGRHFHARVGFESLAQLYALPFALLMWGTIAFLAAFLGMCFQSSDNLARSLLGCSTLVVFIGVLWCFYHNNIQLPRIVLPLTGLLRVPRIGNRASVGSAVV
ncbi:hypothetical protein C8R44DRAFT_892493 [Mycena epipterygia]|nr:hypothetical protein C8R44DRAFT_892493 [Mycena epipterygia]